MNSKALTLTAAAFGLLTLPAYASDNWTGLYEGIDPLTGAEISLSIEPKESDAYQIVVHTPIHSQCAGEALLTGTGTLDEDRLLRLDTSVACDSADPIPSPDAVYFKDVDRDLIYSAVPTDSRYINYHRVQETS